MPGVIRNNTNGSIELSPNFFLSEFLDSQDAERKGIINTPTPIAVQNLFKVAALLERIRKELGNVPIIVSSGYRCPELNEAIGGSPTSEHMTGMACDFVAPKFGTPLQICQRIIDAKIPFGQLIYEGSWVHISVADGKNDGQVMTAKFRKGQKTLYPSGLVP